jgi:hypothetical protein
MLHYTMGMQTRAPASADRNSRLRQALYHLRAELGRLLLVFLNRQPMMTGSIYELRRKCGKPSCRCAQGVELHSSTVISWTSKGRKRLRTVPQGQRGRLTELTRRYQLFRQARARLVEVQARMLAIIDQLEAVRRKEP